MTPAVAEPAAEPANEQAMNTPQRAVILLSGGLDSTTCLAIAHAAGYDCFTLSVAYGQRHAAELKASARIAHSMGACEHRVAHVSLGEFGGSALTDATIGVPVDGHTSGIPVTYVPARNTIMLSMALAWAEVLQAGDIFIGVNAVDYSGYPDCRPAFIEAFETMANLATRSGVEGTRLRVHAPLMRLSKGEIIRKGLELGVDYGQTVSCYQADDNGRACGVCDACRLRRAGFEAAGISDPTPYQRANGVA